MSHSSQVRMLLCSLRENEQDSVQNTSGKQQPRKLLPEVARSSGEVIVDLHLLDEPLVDGIAKRLSDRSEAWRFARHAMAELLRQVEPRLEELETENAKLRKALAHHYEPTMDEVLSFDEHCNMVWSAGGSPPDEDAHWADIALNRWEAEHD